MGFKFVTPLSRVCECEPPGGPDLQVDKPCTISIMKALNLEKAQIAKKEHTSA